MGVTFNDNTDENRYEHKVDGTVAGFEVYELAEGRVSLVHTEGFPDYAAQGSAPQLVMYDLNDARSRGMAVLPFCPYVATVIRQHPKEYLDPVPEPQREHFTL